QLKGCFQDFFGEANEKTGTFFVAGFTEISADGKKGFSFAPPGTGLGFSYTNITTYTTPLGPRFYPEAELIDDVIKPFRIFGWVLIVVGVITLLWGGGVLFFNPSST